jgi:4-hydroxythreonine-4-phosphate dehydrogenase
MMLAGKKLRVALVTIHCALKDVPALLSKTKVLGTIRITAAALEQDFGISKPRLAVAALNPHAGEDGLFGEEEESIIRPAIRKAKAEGYRVEGPFPADSLFYRAAGGEFDAVVAMYHDQGLIPLKLLHFSDAVNVTLGLPVVRTSVDHGTAYDIAGKDMADPSSLKAAIEMAVMMVKNRTKSA